VISCHGSFATATCVTCRRQVDGEVLAEDILQKRIARCPSCSATNPHSAGCTGVMKPDIVFFGERLPEEFFRTLEEDLPQADLMIVMGTSLQVAPVSEIVPRLPSNIPVVLVNRELVGQPHHFDVELLGDSDEVVRHLWEMLDKESISESMNIAGCSIAEDARSIVDDGGVARWLPRPSTFLFPGFCLPVPDIDSHDEELDVASHSDDVMSSDAAGESAEGTDSVELRGEDPFNRGQDTVDAYDTSWGIERPRPKVSLLSSMINHHESNAESPTSENEC